MIDDILKEIEDDVIKPHSGQYEGFVTTCQECGSTNIKFTDTSYYTGTMSFSVPEALTLTVRCLKCGKEVTQYIYKRDKNKNTTNISDDVLLTIFHKSYTDCVKDDNKSPNVRNNYQVLINLYSIIQQFGSQELREIIKSLTEDPSGTLYGISYRKYISHHS